MGKEEAGKRDGTGSFKGSDQARQGREGQRAERGETCPAK